MDQLCRPHGWAAQADVLKEPGILNGREYGNRRFGRLDYLERVCHANPCGSVKAEMPGVRDGMRRILWRKRGNDDKSRFRQYNHGIQASSGSDPEGAGRDGREIPFFRDGCKDRHGRTSGNP